jgi:hypothetical protein
MMCGADISDYTKAAELGAAFPGYAVQVLPSRDGRHPRYEALNRNGGNSYCLISDDLCEIRHSLRNG